MFLIIGLGNPGKKYENTRHNVGFVTVDYLCQKFSFDKFVFKEKFKAEISLGHINGQRIILAKPYTYMNNSGQSVSLLKNYYKIQPDKIITLYDELDLPFSEIRLRHGGSSAGHKGIKSIIEYLGTDQFDRLRVGIRNGQAEKIPADKFVLSNFSFFEKRKLKKNILPRVIDEILKSIE